MIYTCNSCVILIPSVNSYVLSIIRALQSQKAQYSSKHSRALNRAHGGFELTPTPSSAAAKRFAPCRRAGCESSHGNLLAVISVSVGAATSTETDVLTPLYRGPLESVTVFGEIISPRHRYISIRRVDQICI